MGKAFGIMQQHHVTLHLTALPPLALIRVFTYLRFSTSQCPHGFIRASFPLAQTCKHLYRLYRLAIYHPSNFSLFTSKCSSSCLLILQHLFSLKIHISSPFDSLYFLTLSFSDHAYSLTRSGQIEPDSSHGQTVLSNRLIATEEQMFDVIRTVARFRYLRQLVFQEVPHCFLDLCQIIRNVPSLQQVIIDDSSSCFNDRSLAYITTLPSLHNLSISSQTSIRLTSLQRLIQLRQLQLKNTLIDDDSLAPVLRNLHNLQVLDVSDTDISPEISQFLPKRLTSLRAGFYTMFGYDDPRRSDKFCSCRLFDEGTEHSPRCEKSTTGLRIRMWSKHVMFLSSSILPMLNELQWGRFPRCYQDGRAFRGLGGLKILRVAGPDYGDEVFEMIPGIEQLELTGCLITDAGLRRVRNKFLKVTNCPFVTLKGMWGVKCEGILWDSISGEWMRVEDFRQLLQQKMRSDVWEIEE